MTIKLATSVFLAWMFAMASSSGNETFAGEPPMEEVTKYINGVPIYNYQFFSRHVKKSSMNEKEAMPFTTWMVKAHDEYDQKMRDFCAFSSMGKRHCTWVTQSWSSFHFNGTQDELTLFLSVHNTMVEFVEPDFEVNIAGAVPDPELPGVVQSDPEWGLDRIDNRRCLSGNYVPGLDGGHGKGINVFILDTGIRITHSDFEGRAVAAFDVNGGFRECNPTDSTCAYDKHSHGSHCAGIVGGKKYGVAKNVKLHAGKVMSDKGPGSTSGIVQGIDWVVTKGARPAIISMSIGGPGRSSAYKRAIDAAFNKGVTVVVAAGNNHSDACKFSPAFVPNAITVGSTAPPQGGACQDQMSSFSNYGTCLDMWAPGSSIRSVGNKCDTCKTVKSGTSMACPAVSGAVALVYAAYPEVTPSEVPALLKKHATKIEVIGQNGAAMPDSPSDFLYIGEDWELTPETYAVYAQLRKHCVSGHNMAIYQGKTVEQCGEICDSTPGCVAYEYSVAYGGGGGFPLGACLPNDGDDPTGCDGAYFNLDLYLPLEKYNRKKAACVNNHNMAFYSGKTVKECATICYSTPGCVGFEFGVAYGGGGVYKPGDCSPQDSADTAGCYGSYNNLDFYVKVRKSGVMQEQAAPDASTNGKLLQVSIGVGAVVGIIIGMTWHKFAARKVQVKPLLG